MILCIKPLTGLVNPLKEVKMDTSNFEFLGEFNVDEITPELIEKWLDMDMIDEVEAGIMMGIIEENN